MLCSMVRFHTCIKMIRTENLIKIFESEDVKTVALNNVNIAIEEGEFVAVMGPSGCGKTSLLNVLGLLDSPTGGQVWIDDKDVSGFNDFQRTNFRKGNIGFIFQNYNLIEELNIYENIELPLIYQRISSRERKLRVHEILDRMSISHRKKSFPRQLSGGQQQRVAIARAIVTNPRIVLADEPTGNLDSVNGAEIMELLSELNNKGTTIVMVTHSATEADKAHRIIQLFDGHVLSENYLKAI